MKTEFSDIKSKSNEPTDSALKTHCRRCKAPLDIKTNWNGYSNKCERCDGMMKD